MAVTVNSTPPTFNTLSECVTYCFTGSAPADGEDRYIRYALLGSNGAAAIIAEKLNIPSSGSQICVDVRDLLKNQLNTIRPSDIISTGTEQSPQSYVGFNLSSSEVVTTYEPTCNTVINAGGSTGIKRILNATEQARQKGYFDGTTKLMSDRGMGVPINKCTDWDWLYVFSPGGSVTVETDKAIFTANTSEGVTIIPFGKLNMFGNPAVPPKWAKLIIGGQTVAHSVFENCGCNDEYHIAFFEPLGGWSCIAFEKAKYGGSVSGSTICYLVGCADERKLTNAKSIESKSFTKKVSGLNNLAHLRAFASSPNRYMIEKNFNGDLVFSEFLVSGGALNVYEDEKVIELTVTGTTLNALPVY